jgi:hypothetical protein
MKKFRLQLLLVSLIAVAQQVPGQNVKLANIALGMSETEVKTALNSSAPTYANQPSDYPEMHFLVAWTETESYAFTIIEGKVAAFSVVHILPPGQLSFLPSGQKPTVSILRSLITKQTWTPSEINKGDTLWFSDASGGPLSDALQCRPQSGEAWLPFGPVARDNLSGSPAISTVDLMKPSTNSYAANCGVSIHLNLTPAESEDSVVTSVRYQVLDIKAMNAFLAKRKR